VCCLVWYNQTTMTAKHEPYEQERIVVDPRILVGKPVIRGTRIPVSLILNLLGHGYDFARIKTAYPELTDEDIQAAVAYSEARLNREEIRRLDQPM
jgi:uncharacterized protein (DUF433 family)